MATDTQAHVRVGDPATELVRSAGAARADLIVLGSRGQTIPHLILGSVAHKVLYRTASSVLIVRGDASADASTGDWLLEGRKRHRVIEPADSSRSPSREAGPADLLRPTQKPHRAGRPRSFVAARITRSGDET